MSAGCAPLPTITAKVASPEPEKPGGTQVPAQPRLADRGKSAHRKRSWEVNMATAWGLRWGLSRTGTLLLAPPAHCARRALHKQEHAKQASSYIPLDRLSISYCRSSGPGGQNVNKVNSKAEVRFHLASADWIEEPVRQKIALTHKNKINKAGELVLTSESSRHQFRNLAECLQKIRDMIAKASQVPKEPSTEDARLQRLRIEKMNRERLRQKRLNSALKTSRRMTMD
ncbi:peptidyl-tRNA hydrolase ICT1, mitochondrial isoform X2 [Mus caroli]|uniref:Large ribosomal subunit protein mL62 n=1 Tax=Mus caroli TaxID=10089 RepID=A0A6P5QQH4_MUSCR|nr:peptidyl-tRNA hydrolase ICT1, mitochondrial isoform X2 [Mus caroli]